MNNFVVQKFCLTAGLALKYVLFSFLLLFMGLFGLSFVNSSPAVADTQKGPLPTATPFVLELQPAAAEGKDAVFSYLVPQNNYGDLADIHLFSWTQDGELNNNRVAIEFTELNAFPDIFVRRATLSFSFNPSSPYGTQHTGETAFTIQRITTPWEEATITWENQPQTSAVNQVSVPTFTTSQQNFTEIDVTNLVRDMVANPQNSHGFMLRLNEENPYKMLLLASSDHLNAQLHPKLTIWAGPFSHQIALPIVHSPSIQEFQPGPAEGQDAVFSSLVPNNNYATLPDIHLRSWTQDATINTNRVALRFTDLEQPVVPIVHANLSLYFNPTSVYGFAHEGETSFYIYRITEPWDEATITWANQPAVDTTNPVLVSGHINSSQNFVDIDVTEYVKIMAQNPQENYGFMLQLVDESPYRILLLASSDHATPGLRPKLTVYYGFETR